MLYKMAWVKKQPAGDGKMQGIARSIKEGAMAFLSAEYRLLAIFVVIASGALFVVDYFVETTEWLIVPAFVVGAVFSAIAGVAEKMAVTNSAIKVVRFILNLLQPL